MILNTGFIFSKSVIFSIIFMACCVLSFDHARANDLTGTLVVVNKSDNSISIIDIQSGVIIASLPTGEGPHELAITHDGKWAVSTDFVGGNSLTVFDIANQLVARRIKLTNYPGPHGIKFLDDQKHVVFTSGPSQHIVFANIFTGEISKALNTHQKTTHMLAVDSTNHFIYTTNIGSNSISKFDFTHDKLLSQIPTLEYPEAINLSQSGKELWYGANKSGQLVVLSTENEQVVAQFSGFKFPYRILFSQNEKIALVPDFNKHELRFFNVNKKTELGKISLEENAGPQGITLHPQKDLAFLSLNSLHKAIAIDIQSRKVIGEYQTGKNPDGIAYSPLVLTK